MTPLAFDVDLNQATLESIAKRAAAGETVLFADIGIDERTGSMFPVEVQTSLVLAWRPPLPAEGGPEHQRARSRPRKAAKAAASSGLAHIDRVSMMGELAASIAHEVNQPLAGVVSNGSACLRWLAGDVPNLDEAREAARRIVRDGKRAGEVIARVRALTRRAATPRKSWT